MKIFVDTNIILDVLGRREPHYQDAAGIWTLAETGKIEAFVSAISFTNISYIINVLSPEEFLAQYYMADWRR